MKMPQYIKEAKNLRDTQIELTKQEAELRAVYEQVYRNFFE